jgi:hypothetical protein
VSSSDRDTVVRRPAALPFRLHASVTCPPPAELALSLAWELGDLDADRVERGHGHPVLVAILLQPRYERDGDLARGLHVARLRCTLPFESMPRGRRPSRPRPSPRVYGLTRSASPPASPRRPTTA